MRTADIPPSGGAYAIEFRLPTPLAITLAGRDRGPLPAGRYVYCGGARGPGGLRARLGRHLSGPRRRHWHVDQLTTATPVVDWWVEVGGHECELVRRLATAADADYPIPGFGASDCRQCRAHLLRLGTGGTLAMRLKRD